jgi:hypothetical protein
VVINEFEVVAEAPPVAPPGGAPHEPPAPGPVSWTTYDVEQIVRRQAERAARLRAD